MSNPRTNDTPKLLTRVSLFFLNHKLFTAGFMTALVVFGALSYFGLLRREGFPAITIPISVANGVYFVDDVDKVDQDVTRPLSQVVGDVEGVESVSTTADDNFFSVIANLEEGLTSKQGNDRIREAVESSGVLPEEVQLDFIDINPAKYLGEYDLLISLYSPTVATLPQELESQAEQLTDDLEELEEVSLAVAEPLFDSGINPATGEQVVQQSSFGRYGERQNGEFTYYNSSIIGVVGVGGDSLDIFKLSDAVQQKIDEINQELGSDYRLAISSDFTVSVNNQISSLQENVLTGLIAVTVISLIMISWRVSLLSVVFMLSVIFTTAGLLFAFGYTLNTITLFALVLSLGLFVDDATIISEALDANKSKRLSKKQIVTRAINSVGSASASGTLTTVMVFVPLLFVTGIIGSFIFLLPLTVIMSLIVSLFLSLTLIPFLAQYTVLTKGQLDKKGWHNPIPDWIATMIIQLKLRPVVGAVIGFVMVSLSVVFLMASGYYAGQLSFNIFPNSKDSDELLVTASLEPSATIRDAENVAEDLNQVIVSTVGEELVSSVYGVNALPSKLGADVLIELTPFRDRDIKSPEIVSKLEAAFENYSRARVTVGQLDAGPPAEDFPFKAQIFSEDLATAERVASDMQNFLQDRAIELQNQDTAVVIRTDVDNLERVVRKESKRFVEVGAGFEEDDVTALVQATRTTIEEEFDEARLESYGLTPEDVEFDFGQESENEESFSSLGPASLAAIGVMFVLLVIQFRSFLSPLLIIMAMPFSFLGVTFGLFTTDNPLSFFAMVGFIGLIGIAVNNTILLTDYAKQQRQNGKSIIDAIAVASRDRFRPLFTTTATTVAALAPLAFFDPFWEPLAITIMFGLVSSTILVILSFPYYYIATELLRDFYSGKRLVWWFAGLAAFAALGIVASSISDSAAFISLLIGGYLFVTVGYGIVYGIVRGLGERRKRMARASARR